MVTNKRLLRCKLTRSLATTEGPHGVLC